MAPRRSCSLRLRTRRIRRSRTAIMPSKYAARYVENIDDREHSGRLNVLHSTEKNLIYLFTLRNDSLYCSPIFSAFQLHFDPARPEKPIQGWNINLFLMFLAPRTNNSCHLYRRYIATHNSFYTRAPNGARMCVRNLAEWPHGAGKSMRKHRLESINAIKSKHFQLD